MCCKNCFSIISYNLSNFLSCTTNTDCTGIVSFCIEQMPMEFPMESQATVSPKASGTQEVTVTKTPITPSSATSAYAAEFLKFVGVLRFPESQLGQPLWCLL